jgi:threonine dehydrogenase-like Zn-dependent dehydrogenase
VTSRFLVNDLELRASHKSPGVWEDVIALVGSGKINLEPLSTHFFQLDDIDKAFAAFGNAEKEKAVRVIVRCDS